MRDVGKRQRAGAGRAVVRVDAIGFGHARFSETAAVACRAAAIDRRLRGVLDAVVAVRCGAKQGVARTDAGVAVGCIVAGLAGRAVVADPAAIDIALDPVRDPVVAPGHRAASVIADGRSAVGGNVTLPPVCARLAGRASAIDVGFVDVLDPVRAAIELAMTGGADACLAGAAWMIGAGRVLEALDAAPLCVAKAAAIFVARRAWIERLMHGRAIDAGVQGARVRVVGVAVRRILGVLAGGLLARLGEIGGEAARRHKDDQRAEGEEGAAHAVGIANAVPWQVDETWIETSTADDTERHNCCFRSYNA